MNNLRYSGGEISKRGREIYAEKLRDLLEPEHTGEFLVINVETGEYEPDKDQVTVMERAAANHPVETLYGMRVGFAVMGRIGATAGRKK